MYEVFMMGVPYLHEDLPEGEFDTLEEAIECAERAKETRYWNIFSRSKRKRSRI